MPDLETGKYRVTRSAREKWTVCIAEQENSAKPSGLGHKGGHNPSGGQWELSGDKG